MGRYRRNSLAPVPEANNLAALNKRLLAGCLASRERTIGGRKTTVNEAAADERRYLLPLAEEGFPIDGPVPTGCGRQAASEGEGQLVLGPVMAGISRHRSGVAFFHRYRADGKRVARHQRSYGRGFQILDLEHYLDVLEKKPGAMAGSTPLEQWRQAGRWPECLDRI